MEKVMRHITIVLIAILPICAAHAQISISYSEFPHSFGTEYYYQIAHNAPVNVGEVGPARTWNFMSWTGDYEGIDAVIPPAGTIAGSNFPLANYCIHNDGSSGTPWVYVNYYYLTWSAPNLMMLGSYDSMWGELKILDNPVPSFAFPIDYGDSFFYLMTYPNGANADSDSVWTKVDAWGTVTTPTGSYPCLRVRRLSRRVIYSGGSPVYSDYMLEYMWIAENNGIVASIRNFSSTPDTSPTSVSGRGYLTSLVVGISDDEQQKPGQISLGVQPNPFNSSCVISVDVRDGCARPATIEIYDLRGKRICTHIVGVRHSNVQSQLEREPLGNASPMQTGAWEFLWQPDNSIASGIYLIRGIMRDGQATAKQIVYAR